MNLENMRKNITAAFKSLEPSYVLVARVDEMTIKIRIVSRLFGEVPSEQRLSRYSQLLKNAGLHYRYSAELLTPEETGSWNDYESIN